MKFQVVSSLFLFFLVFVVCFALAIPVTETSVDSEHSQGNRTKRDLNGVFDSISNGFEGLMKGARKVSNSVFEAFNNIFSSGNMNAISDGFEKFGKGVRDAVNGMFTSTRDKMNNGFKKIKDKINSGWSGKDESAPSATTELIPVQKTEPEGEVPKEETT